jgi:drug/metabolite transporter (DMT)-like permease
MIAGSNSFLNSVNVPLMPFPYRSAGRDRAEQPSTCTRQRRIRPLLEKSLSSSTANRRGILAMLTAMTLFTGNDVLTKIATDSLPPGQIMAVRGVFAVLLTFGLVVALGEARHLKELKSPVVFGRGLLEAGVAFTFLTALGRLQLANITAILQATPIMITVLTVIMGLETVRWRRWTAIIVGFVGVLLIVKPSPSGFNVYAGLALVSAALVAVRDLVTHAVPSHIPTVLVTLSTTVTVTILGVALSLGEDWRPLPTVLTIQLASAAVLVTLGNLAIIKAFRLGELSVVSPFRYSVILTSLLAGFIIFGELPDLISVFGIVLIVSSGLYTIHREQVRLRQDRQNAPAAATAGEVP